jgi:hypothetical protein
MYAYWSGISRQDAASSEARALLAAMAQRVN